MDLEIGNKNETFQFSNSKIWAPSSSIITCNYPHHRFVRYECVMLPSVASQTCIKEIKWNKKKLKTHFIGNAVEWIQPAAGWGFRCQVVSGDSIQRLAIFLPSNDGLRYRFDLAPHPRHIVDFYRSVARCRRELPGQCCTESTRETLSGVASMD